MIERTVENGRKLLSQESRDFMDQKKAEVLARAEKLSSPLGALAISGISTVLIEALAMKLIKVSEIDEILAISKDVALTADRLGEEADTAEKAQELQASAAQA